jgi:hypothetical protein
VSGRRPYDGAEAALATMHGKAAALGPPLARALGLRLRVPTGLDTDRLGSFTGEIPRPGPMEETAIAKARMGMAAAGLPLGLASEGSYGPHPQLPFLALGVELLAWIDAGRGLTVIERMTDPAPAYDQAEAGGMAALAPFLDRAGFPRTALIVRPNSGGPAEKGLREPAALARAVTRAARASADGLAFVQTDMRAHVNPRRMATIGRLAEKLAARLARPCPACAAPGFGLTAVARGLPCAWCRRPGEMVRHERHGCAGCGHEERRPRPDGLTEADPANCPICNP